MGLAISERRTQPMIEAGVGRPLSIMLAEFGHHASLDSDRRGLKRQLQQEVVIIDGRNAFVEADGLRQAASDEDGWQGDVAVGPNHGLDESALTSLPGWTGALLDARARRIDERAFAVTPVSARVRLEALHLQFELTWMPAIVRVEKADVRAACVAKSGVADSCDVAAVGEMDDADP